MPADRSTVAKRSREKGKHGERMAVKFLHDLGFPDARRTHQYNGVGLSDVVCEESLPHVHIEVKTRKDILIGTKVFADAVYQAMQDCPKGQGYVVLWKQTNRVWCLTRPATLIGDMPDHSTAPTVMLTVSGSDDIRNVLRYTEWQQVKLEQVEPYRPAAPEIEQEMMKSA